MKEKVVFLVKCLVVLLPLFAMMIYTKDNMLNFIDDEAPYYIWNKTVCTDGHERYDVIILGDSVANAAYMPEVLSEHCINLALGGTTPMENYYTLKGYLENNGAPDIAYISFMDFHLQRLDCFWGRSMYSHRYGWKDSWEMLKTAQKYDEASIAVEDAESDWIAYTLYLPNKYITALINGGFDQRYDGNIRAYNLDALHKGRYIARGVQEWAGTAVGFDQFYVAPLFDHYYKKLIGLCLDNDIKVHIIKLPLPETDTFTDEYDRQFTDYYDDLKKLYPEIMVDWWESYEPRFFSDAHHMNDHGALRFSSELKDKYPDGFDDPFTGERLDALNDSVRSENYLSEMMRWASVCNGYSLVIYDGSDEDLEPRYDNGPYQDDLIVSKKTLTGGDETVYIVGTQGGSAGFDGIYENGGSLDIDPGDGNIYEWDPYGYQGVDMLVIDNVHGQVVCEKRFQYVEGHFVLQN